MADRLEDLLRGCTVRVTGGPMPGAGFFLAPGRVLTCVHVIGNSADLVVHAERDGRPVIKARVSGRVAVLANKGRPIPALDRDYPDIAVLEVGGLVGHPCVGIDSEWPSLEDSFQIFGYPKEGGAVQLTPARLTYRGTHGTLPTAYLDLASDTIKPGMSGAAVLNLRTAGVCGVVVASKHPAHPDGALAIPWSAIAADLGEVLAANRAFHIQDRRWDAAASQRGRLRFRLPRVVAHFTGRDDLLAQLDAALGQRQTGVITQAISGLGGVGKTQLAAAYVAAHHDKFDIAAWVRADDGGIADLAELAVALRLPVTGRTPPERASDVLVFLSNTDRRWLLVFDNAPGPHALSGLLPSSGQGRVLVTSRHRGGYDAFGVELVVDVFDPATARRYLLARSGRTGLEADDADAVAAALGCLPLALAHAGAYCASDTGVALGRYLELLEELPSQDVFDTNPEVFYQHTVAATWNTSIAAAEQRAPLARRALEMTAYLAPEAIPRSFFAVLEENSALGRKRVADALAALHRYSLASVADNQVSVHRLLQKVIRDQLAGHDQASAAAHALTAVQRAAPGDPRLPATWPQWQELVPHAAALASIEVAASINAAQLVGTLNLMCLFLVSAGSPLAALDLATRAVRVSSHLGPEHPQVLTAWGILALSYRAAGRTGEAITIEERIAADSERLLGPEHPDTLTAWGNLALSYRAAGRTGEAITIEERIAADSERLLGPEHLDTLTAWANLAGSYQAAGRTSEAITIQERVAGDFERLLGPEHPNTLTVGANLAFFYHAAGRTSEAITIQERVAADSERLLGPEHPDTLRARASLAASYQGAGRTSEAITILEQVATDSERLLGPDHPGTLTARNSLADSYQAAGRTGEAITILEQVAADNERLLGPDHPGTLHARGSLATSYWSAGRTSHAMAIQRRVAADSERLLGPEHPDTLTAWANLAGSYQEAGRTGEAITIQERVAADFERVLGPEHPQALIARANLALSYRAAGRTGEAITIQDRVATDFERVLGPEHPQALIARANLALSYRAAGRTGEATAIEERVAADSERLLGPEHPDTLRARGNLAASYLSAGRTSETTAIEERIAADSERLLGPEHPDTLRARGNLAASYLSAGRTGEATAIQERVAADSERLLGPEHPDTLRARGNLALSYRAAGRTGEATAIEERIAADFERLLGPEHPDTLRARSNLAASYWLAGRTGEATAIQERVAADSERLLGPEHPDTLAAHANLARVKTNRDKSPRD